MGEIFEHVMPKAALSWTGERLTTAVGGQIEIEHLHRYVVARDFCRGLDVLDVASGEGYGTALLAQVARSAVGVEISAEAADHASTQYGFPNLRYVQGDARKMPLVDASVDVVVSFETIEHFYEHDDFLREIRRVLRPDGLLVISSPDRDYYSPPGTDANPYHKRELSRAEFQDLIGRYFQNARLLCQRTLLGSVLMSDQGEAGPTVTIERRGANHFERSDGVSRPPYVIGFASDAALPVLSNSLYVGDGEIGPLIARAAEHPALKSALTDAVSRATNAEAAFHASQAELTDCMGQATEERGTALKRALELQDGLFAANERCAALTAERNAVAAERDAVASERNAAAAVRDSARLALRRATVSAGSHALNASLSRIAALTEEISALNRQKQELTERAIRAETNLHQTDAQFQRLLRVARLVPRPIRRLVRSVVLPR